jgi:hypothetical protein
MGLVPTNLPFVRQLILETTQNQVQGRETFGLEGHHPIPTGTDHRRAMTCGVEGPAGMKLPGWEW